MNTPLSRGLRLVLVLAMGAWASLHAQTTDGFFTVSASVSTAGRIALPVQAVLTVQLEDVSRADARATVLAQTSEALGARRLPIAFSLKVPRAAIDPRLSYALRASIRVGSELRFTTTRHHAVLTRGAPTHLDLVLDAVPSSHAPFTPTPTPAPASRPGFALPATFTGLTPCADCAGMVQTLTLRDHGHYQLRRTYLGKPDGPFTEQGRWTVTPDGRQLTLGSGTGATRLAVTDAATLRLLDQTGRPIRSSAPLELRRTAQVDTFSESLPAAPATLKDTYWKLVELGGETVAMAAPQKREVRITLASEGARLSGFSGCNPVAGTYLLDGAALRLTHLAATLMACEPPLIALEARVLAMLGATTAYRIDGEQLSLLAGTQALARFEAVYLR